MSARVDTAPSRRAATLADIQRHRVSAIIRAGDRGKAERAMDAAVRGGFRIVEFTLTTPGALDLVREFASRRDLVVGAGTVLDVQVAREAVAAGARFLVSPVTDPEVIRETLALDAVSIPGTSTPTEMLAAIRAGAEILKIFPAPADLPAFITQVRGPFPDWRLFPTAGVTQQNVEAVLRAGAFGAGFVASLFTPADMASGDYAAIENRARVILETVRSIH
ncbi:MAG TPA: bifunctional 4-hydroxy-2-oxoglutarate aldolase/2-dehydro-3-deoxy-phosphogluconate aldolase [Candidatus Eisenbacteria bacterium]|nr:bifunctional 4-hydroxy-2-oxoglutarate aldolase/2-dehydro-3-deoxy-phosphogluconate aldolase [Candidatus Eisenbacteria bacterium]